MSKKKLLKFRKEKIIFSFVSNFCNKIYLLTSYHIITVRDYLIIVTMFLLFYSGLIFNYRYIEINIYIIYLFSFYFFTLFELIEDKKIILKDHEIIMKGQKDNYKLSQIISNQMPFTVIITIILDKL